MTKMRFRTDGWHHADLKIVDESFDSMYGDTFTGCPEDDAIARRTWAETPKAEPGDVWRIFWYHHDGPDGEQINDRIAGYAICCPGCRRVHNWTCARNCASRIPGGTCSHSGTGSCWNWTGSAEEGTLTCTPSLQVLLHEVEPGGCDWHGYITQGDLHN